MVLRRWWLIVAVIAAAVGLAIVWSSLQTRQYASTVRILVDTDSSAEIFDPVSAEARGARAMTNEAELAESFLVRSAAVPLLEAAGFGGDPTMVEIGASEVTNADVLELRAVALTPTDATLAAEIFADVYIDLRRNQVVEDYLETARVIQENFDDTQRRLDALGEESSSERRVLESQLEAFGAALSQLDVSAELGGAAARIIEPATVPTDPFVPRTTRNVSLAILLGVLAGLAGAILLDTLDTAIETRADIEAASGGSPNLGIIPSIRDWKDTARPRIVTLERTDSSEAEAYRVLRAALDFATLDRDAKVLQITSANPGEGKTTTTINLAVALARSGKRVIVVDGDLRKPRVHSFFDVPREPGFTDLVLGTASGSQAGRHIDGVDGRLVVIPSGPTPPGPSEFLGSKRTARVIAQLAQRCDVLLLDSPPVLPVSDPLVLSAVSDGVILVANGGQTSAGELADAVNRLEQVDARLIGTVLNAVRHRRRGYGYGYGNGYTD